MVCKRQHYLFSFLSVRFPFLSLLFRLWNIPFDLASEGFFCHFSKWGSDRNSPFLRKTMQSRLYAMCFKRWLSIPSLRMFPNNLNAQKKKTESLNRGLPTFVAAENICCDGCFEDQWFALDDVAGRTTLGHLNGTLWFSLEMPFVTL